ncbi:polysaccharide deacetylase family protein [Oceanicoccus sp. KOV_DT_Chl]|uniref:polysaccharide deacetylase family protein n=1 Tax=Oceanicoccus sp. KOV_DT_Chl TaxID=1904639 RepID=UPI0013575112|nr:polysaccharide deacetylase family protein [Oceanicoccus sp. KOV_DT_Chl]
MLYHHVAEDTPAITSIKPEHFKQQLAYLKAQGFKVWPLADIVAALQKNIAIPDKVIAITFDDSYQSVYDTAYPLLKSYNWPFTIFASTDSIDSAYNHQTSWQQLREMAANGATISNHSATHGHLLKRQDNESDAQWQQRVSNDITKAQKRIKQEIGTENFLFAYPYGENNQALRQLVKTLGYIGFGQQSGAVGEHSDPLNLPRFPFSGHYTDLEDFALKAHTLALPVIATTGEDYLLSNTQRQPKLQLTLADSFTRKDALQCFASNQGPIKLEWMNNNRVSITPNKDIPVGRSRYNCTALFNSNNQPARYYWYSHPWLRLGEDDQWPAE